MGMGVRPTNDAPYQTPDCWFPCTCSPALFRAARVKQLADEIRMMPDDEERAKLYFDYMLSHGPDLERSIAGLNDAMLAELNVDVGMMKGI